MSDRKLDSSKITTLEDVKLILGALNIYVKEGTEDFKKLEHLLEPDPMDEFLPLKPR